MKFKLNDKSGAVAMELGPQEKQLPVALSSQQPRALPVFDLKKILVPLDFSDCSEKAIIYAATLAQEFGADLTLLHVAQSYPPVPEKIPVAKDLDPFLLARKELEIRRLNVGSVAYCETLIKAGTPHLEIVKAARELGTDLIVISTHGHTGLAHLLLGGTTDKVVRRAPCPVLVVREKEHEFIKPPVPHEN